MIFVSKKCTLFYETILCYFEKLYLDIGDGELGVGVVVAGLDANDVVELSLDIVPVEELKRNSKHAVKKYKHLSSKDRQI